MCGGGARTSPPVKFEVRGVVSDERSNCCGSIRAIKLLAESDFSLSGVPRERGATGDVSSPPLGRRLAR